MGFEFVRKCLSQKSQRHKDTENLCPCASVVLSEAGAIDDVLKGAAISVELVLRRDTDEVINLAIG